MTAISKTSCKALYETGDHPTQSNFADLIDSYQDAAVNLGTLSSASLGVFGLSMLSTTTTAAAQNLIGVQVSGADISNSLITPTSASTAITAATVASRVYDIRAFGASTAASAVANTTAINAAITAANSNNGGIVFIPAGTFNVNQILMKSYVTLKGVNRNTSILTNSDANSTAVIISSNPASTIIWCGLEDLRVLKPSATSGQAVDMTAWMFSSIKRNWITANPIAGVFAIYLAANFGVTEATYNHFEHNYIGLCAVGLYMNTGANSNNIYANRFQIGVSAGSGVFITASAADQITNNNIIGNGFEFTGNSMRGVSLFNNSNGTVIIGNRFEQLLDGIIVFASSNLNVFAPYAQNSFFQCTTNINLQAGADSVAYSLRAAIQGSAQGTFTLNGTAFNCSARRASQGNYPVQFKYGAMQNTTYTVDVTELGPFFSDIISKTVSGFVVRTFNAAVSASDVPYFNVKVYNNR